MKSDKSICNENAKPVRYRVNDQEPLLRKDSFGSLLSYMWYVYEMTLGKYTINDFPCYNPLSFLLDFCYKTMGVLYKKKQQPLCHRLFGKIQVQSYTGTSYESRTLRDSRDLVH